MKWIGQHIWDFTSRFRNDIYFEGLAETAETRGLVVDANGKVSINPLSGDEHATHVYENVRNDEGSTIPVGTPVYSKGEIGGSERIKVGIADASDPAKMPAIGITNTELTTTGDTKDGLITLVGVYNTNLSGFSGVSENDIVYVAIGGGLTITKPTGVNLIQNIGIVLKTNGPGTIIQGLQVTCIGRTNDVPTPLYIDHTNQRVGIGTTSPSTKLHIEDSSHVYSTLQSTDANTEVAHKYRSSTLTSGYYWWTGLNNYDKYQIAYGTSFDNAGTALCVDTSGNVGIGTTSPAQKLHVVGDARIQGNLTVNGTYTQIDTDVLTTEQWLVTNDGTGPAAVINQLGSQDIFDVQDDGTSVFYIEDGGQIGIGTTSPTARLHIESADDAVVRLKSTDNKAYIALSDNDTDGYISSENSRLSLGANPYADANNLNIDLSNNNVGIGTTSPDHKFHVEFTNGDTSFSGGGLGNWGSDGIRIENTSGTVDTMAMLQFRNADADIHIAGIRQGTNDSDLGFFFEGSEKMRIDSSGKVGIGTTSPNKNLTVEWLSDNTVITQEGLGGGTAGRGVLIQNGSFVANTYANLDFRAGNADGRIAYKYNSINDGDFHFITDNGNNPETKLFIKNNGKVGIGTTNPLQELQVDGSIYANGGDLYVNDGKALISVGDLLFKTFESGAYHERARILANGNVGIGTTSPGYKLDVNGSVNTAFGATNGYRINTNRVLSQLSGGVEIGVLDYKTIYPNISFNNDNTFRVQQNGSTKVIVNSSGNVGIGTTSPNEKLEVDGNIRLANSGKLYLWQSHDANYLQYYRWELSSSLTAYINNSGSGGVALKTAGNTRLHIDNSGNVGIGTTSPNTKLQVAGDIRADYNIIFSGTGFINNNTGSLELETVGNKDILFNPNGTGNVGIGTTSPSYALDIKKDDASVLHLYRPNSSTAASANLDFSFNTADASQALYARITADVETNTNSAQGGDLSFHTANAGTISEVMRLTEEGNVGIGTTSPSSLLHIEGSAPKIQFTDTSTSASSYIDADSAFGSLNIMADQGNSVASSQINLLVDGSSKMVIKDTGNVGIGTTSPSEKLTIEQTSAGSDVYPLQLSNVSTTDSTGVGIIFNVSSNRGYDNARILVERTDNDATGEMSFWTVSGNSGAIGERMRIDKDGNVGIGTTSPGNKLEVNSGTTNVASVFKSSDNQAWISVQDDDSGTYGALFGTDTDAGHDIILADSSANKRLVIDSAGNVGIGTSSPGEKLEVAGNISIGDSNELKIGASDDLRLYHDGSDSYLRAYGTTDLIIMHDQADRDIKFKADDGSGGTTTYLTIDGSATRTNVHKNMLFDDSVTLGIGAGYDLQLYHNGST